MPRPTEYLCRTSAPAIFDVDGVLVDSPHARAWRESLRELMEGDWSDTRARTTWSPDAFTPQVYQTQVSGKPRTSGARAVLDYFHVPDDDEASRVAEYADRKQHMVVRLIEAGEFTAHADALRFVLDVKDAGFRIATASSSKNANLLLAKIRLDNFGQIGLTLRDVFDADVSGRAFPRGKPDPDMFLAAADALATTPEDAVVVEDAVAGVRGRKREAWHPSGSRAPTTKNCWSRRVPTSSSTASTTSIALRSPRVNSQRSTVEASSASVRAFVDDAVGKAVASAVITRTRLRTRAYVRCATLRYRPVLLPTACHPRTARAVSG